MRLCVVKQQCIVAYLESIGIWHWKFSAWKIIECQVQAIVYIWHIICIYINVSMLILVKFQRKHWNDLTPFTQYHLSCVCVCLCLLYANKSITFHWKYVLENIIEIINENWIDDYIMDMDMVNIYKYILYIDLALKWSICPI